MSNDTAGTIVDLSTTILSNLARSGSPDIAGLPEAPFRGAEGI